MALSCHWRLLQGGENSGVTATRQIEIPDTGLPDLERQVRFCQEAEALGIDSLLVDINFSKPDPMMLATALATRTKKIRFMIAVRSGLLSPTLFVQQVNTFSAMFPGRICLNVVAGHSPAEQRFYGDHLNHDDRYGRTEEFLSVCHAFWNRTGPVDFHGEHFSIERGRLNTPFLSVRNESHPKVFIGGGSRLARDLAIRQGSCWMRLADTPESIGPAIRPVMDAGKEAGLRLSIIARETRHEALAAASRLTGSLSPRNRERQKELERVKESDSHSINASYHLADEEWLTPTLWAGAVRTHGAPSIALVGSAEEVAAAILDYKRVGISQFILSGWPKLDEMRFFGERVLPLIRERESESRDD